MLNIVNNRPLGNLYFLSNFAYKASNFLHQAAGPFITRHVKDLLPDWNSPLTISTIALCAIGGVGLYHYRNRIPQSIKNLAIQAKRKIIPFLKGAIPTMIICYGLSRLMELNPEDQFLVNATTHYANVFWNIIKIIF